MRNGLEIFYDTYTQFQSNENEPTQYKRRYDETIMLMCYSYYYSLTTKRDIREHNKPAMASI